MLPSQICDWELKQCQRELESLHSPKGKWIYYEPVIGESNSSYYYWFFIPFILRWYRVKWESYRFKRQWRNKSLTLAIYLDSILLKKANFSMKPTKTALANGGKIKFEFPRHWFHRKRFPFIYRHGQPNPDSDSTMIVCITPKFQISLDENTIEYYDIANFAIYFCWKIKIKFLKKYQIQLLTLLLYLLILSKQHCGKF